MVNDKFIVGLTGGIGSGKSLIASLFESLGNSEIIDVDVIARKVVEIGSIGLSKIIEEFGKQVLNEDGSLNRKYLRNIIFNNYELKAKLESIIHPLINEETDKLFSSSAKPYILYVVPLMYETGLYKRCDYVIAIEVDYEIQLERVIRRDNQSIEQVKKIINSQATNIQRISIANEIIYNNKSIDYGLNDLKERIYDLDTRLVSLSKNKKIM